MNLEEQRFLKRAMIHYGVSINSEVMWFIDSNKVYYGRKNNNGEISDYLSGYISGRTYAIDYSSLNEQLDIGEWKKFFAEHLHMDCIDTRH